MNVITAHAIGDEVGEFMEMEADLEPNKIVAGRFMRVKVKLDIRKPLKRGVTISLGEDVEDRWFPYHLSFCPNFAIPVALLFTWIGCVWRTWGRRRLRLLVGS